MYGLVVITTWRFPYMIIKAYTEMVITNMMTFSCRYRPHISYVVAGIQYSYT